MKTLEQAYQEIGADYEGVVKRLMGDKLLGRFLLKFFEDTSFRDLKTALAESDVKAAFIASHTLKGVCQNLGLSNIFEPADELTEVLRAESLEGAQGLFAKVETEYNNTIEALKPCFE